MKELPLFLSANACYFCSACFSGKRPPPYYPHIKQRKAAEIGEMGLMWQQCYEHAISMCLIPCSPELLYWHTVQLWMYCSFVMMKAVDFNLVLHIPGIKKSYSFQLLKKSWKSIMHILLTNPHPEWKEEHTILNTGYTCPYVRNINPRLENEKPGFMQYQASPLKNNIRTLNLCCRSRLQGDGQDFLPVDSLYLTLHSWTDLNS